MADSILRLRVESQEYDNKLKRAAEGIRHLADVAHQGGGVLPDSVQLPKVAQLDT